jgi:predicted esterase YcpF (UPF0227 family)
MKKCDENIAKLDEENKKKEEEILRKKRVLEILTQKKERITKKRLAVQKYQDFLEEVRANNSDQYGQVSSIIDRHKTL